MYQAVEVDISGRGTIRIECKAWKLARNSDMAPENRLLRLESRHQASLKPPGFSFGYPGTDGTRADSKKWIPTSSSMCINELSINSKH